MRFYVASSYNNRHLVRVVHRYLERQGHHITYDWTVHEWHPGAPRHLWAINDIQGVRAADTVVVLMPGRLGTHIEMGAALGLGKPVLMVTDAPDDSHIFYLHPLVIQCRSIREGLEKLGLQIEARP